MAIKEKSQKQLQVAEQIKREIAKIFLQGDIFKDNNLRLTVCQADISPNLKNVKLFIDISDDIEKKEDLILQLNNSSNYFRRQLSISLKLKNIPQISFIIDESSSNAIKIQKALDEENGTTP